MKLKPCLFSALFCTATAFAQGTFTFTPSSMGPIIPGNWPSSTNSQSFTFPTPAVSLANYNAVQVTFSAPSGYAWQVTPSRQGQIFGCSVAYSSPGTDYHQSADYSFNFVPGMASTVYGGVTDQRLSEQSFGFSSAFQFGGSSPVEFTDFTVTLHYLPLHGWQVAQRLLAPFDQSLMNIIYTGIPDSNPHLFLVPTPEPGVGALAVLGAGLAMIVRSGRRFGTICSITVTWLPKLPAVTESAGTTA